ncbi:hypothetical protein MLD38_021449 [Melastoma candidum]|uniref:Uncharacterized protein n=1 Tax=Melastoma candidum TaxID=119954 RepID=A0ACB9QJZ8_9MYRT|nr:hypothetical protein MLD38_021449 [Melastoma candidum]
MPNFKIVCFICRDVDCVDFAAVALLKRPLIAKAAKRLIQSSGDLKSELKHFLRDPDVLSWLQDAAYFAAIDHKLDTLRWYYWPDPLKDSHSAAMEDIRHSEKEFMRHINGREIPLSEAMAESSRLCGLQQVICIMGDMPIYILACEREVPGCLLNVLVVLAEQGWLPHSPDAFSELWNK